MDNFNEKILTVNDKMFKYVESGSGKLVLLVHGWPENWSSWKNQMSLISDLGYKAVAFNIRGYADSYSPKEISSYSMRFFMEDILDIISFFNKKSAILIGHDWGAPICWKTAAYNKDKIDAVIGLSVPFTRRGKISSTELWKNLYKDIFFYQNYFQKINQPELELEKNVFDTISKIYYWCSAEGYIDKVKTTTNLDSGLLDGLRLPLDRLSWLKSTELNHVVNDFKKSGFLGSLNRYRAQDLDWIELEELDYLQIDQPSIFIGGEYDPVRFFIKNYDAYKEPGKYCKNYKGTHIVKKSGHWVQQEKPKEVNKIIKDFLISLI